MPDGRRFRRWRTPTGEGTERAAGSIHSLALEVQPTAPSLLHCMAKRKRHRRPLYAQYSEQRTVTVSASLSRFRWRREHSEIKRRDGRLKYPYTRRLTDNFDRPKA